MSIMKYGGYKTEVVVPRRTPTLALRTWILYRRGVFLLSMELLLAL